MWLAECPNTITPTTRMVTVDTWKMTNAFFSTAYDNNNEMRSEWINLTKGEPYYMEIHYIEYNGNDHMSTGVEFEQTAIVGHHQAMKEI